MSINKQVKKANSHLANPNKYVEQQDSFTKCNSDPVNAEELLKPNLPQLVTVDMLKKVYTKKVNNVVLQECADTINNSIGSMDSIQQIHYRDNVFSFMDILNDGENKISVQDYLNAVKFSMHKMAGNTDVRAYALTFPDRIQRMSDEKLPNSYLYAYANSYARNKTVVKILTKMMVPAHIQYQDIFSQAVKVQATIMNDDKVSPKVRSDAANSLMTHLKQPEIKQMELGISTKDSGVIAELANALNNLGSNTVELMKSGKYTMKELREATIIEGELNEE